jgi:CheY-like chemotaxis protein
MWKEVLVVDDSLVSRVLISTSLTNSWYKVDQAVNWIEGLTKSSNKKLIAIFMDVEMPWLDWISVTKKIRDQWIKTPIFWIWWNSEYIPDWLKAWMDNFVVKPFNMKIINELLDGIKK